MTSLRNVVTLSGIAVGATLAGGATYLGLVTGAAPLDLGIGRRTRPLGPLHILIHAPRQTVFEIIGAPYGERAPQSYQKKVRVIERGTDMVLAAHYTPIVVDSGQRLSRSSGSTRRSESTSDWFVVPCRTWLNHSIWRRSATTRR